MSLLAFDDLPGWAVVLALAAHLVAGLGLGALHFGGLWWNVRLFARGGRASTTILLMIGRFILLGGVLVLASLEGALPLLLTALGILAARFVVLRSVREAAP